MMGIDVVTVIHVVFCIRKFKRVAFPSPVYSCSYWFYITVWSFCKEKTDDESKTSLQLPF